MPNPNNIPSASQLLWLYSTILSNAHGSFMFFNSIFAPRATLNATIIWIYWYRLVFRVPFILPMAVAEIGFVVLLHCAFRFMWKWTLLWILGLNNVVIFACYFIPLILRHMHHREGLAAAKPPLINQRVDSMWPFMHQAFFVNTFSMNDIWWVPFGYDAHDGMQFYLGLILILEGLVFLFFFRKLAF